ncbi:MAG TPA: transglutaminaseTgpA domain-containing protein [Gaiellaceae bacterium]|nr:transglutaminaseTgpA domain-containing protein [Gaiellaceae bacterium]
MLRTLVLGGIAGTLIAWNWLRLEDGKSGGEALLIIVLAVVPALFPRLRERVAAAAVAFLIAAGIAFDQGPGLHYPGRVLGRFGQGFLDFYDVKLPFDGAAQPRMHGTILLATFAFTLATALAVAASRPRWATLALLIGAGWPATLLAGHDYQRGGAILAGLLVLLVGIRERPRAVGYAPLAGLLVVVVGLLASSSTALARHGFVNWQSWDFYTRPAKPVSVSYVWNSDYSGLTFPRKETVVLKIQAPSRPQYWRAVTLDDVVGGRWYSDPAPQVQSAGFLGEPGLVPRAAARRANWVEQRVHVEALRDNHLIAASIPVQVDAQKLGLIAYDPSGMAFVSLERGLQRGDSYTAWSYEPEPTPDQLARSKPVYPQLISVQRKYLAVDQDVFVPPFGTRGRHSAIDWLFTQSTHASEIDPYRPLYDKAEEIAGGAKSPYAAAFALESWFRASGSFLYEQHPPKPPGNTPPLVDFVTRTQEGYCQHFAGAMALMLRYLGVPARVVAGFSSGSYDKHSGDWTVTDHDAHEWVEAWFQGWGWVPFDPTPGRGGLAGSYSSSSRAFDAAAAALVLAGKEGLKSFNSRRTDLGLPQLQQPHVSPDVPDLKHTATAALPEHDSRTPGILRLLFLLVAGLVAAITLAKLLLRRSRYLTRDPRRLAAACRKELRDVLVDQLVDVPSSATLSEVAALAEAELGVSAAEFGRHGTAARFAPPASAREAARELRREMRELRKDVRRQLNRFERTRGLLSLRSLGLA